MGNQYVTEQTSISCTCTARDLGLPAGRLIGQWNMVEAGRGNVGETTVAVTKMVTKSNDGDVLTCVIDWATDTAMDLKSTYNVIVACEFIMFM